MEGIENYLHTSTKRYPKVVFCDLFDTLILRTVHPEHVKKLASKRLCRELALKSHPESLYQLRAQIERDLCKKNEFNGFDPDFNFDVFATVIYGELNRIEPEALGRLCLAEFTETVCAIESQVETAVQRLDPSVAGLLREFDSQGIPIYGVSDFYLPRRMILDFLKKHHVESLFRDVFVSSESLLTKRSGRLYDLVLQSIGVEPHLVLMIGDNEHADYVMARQKGINTHIVNRSEQRKFYHDHFVEFGNIDTVRKRLTRAELAKTDGSFQPGSHEVHFQHLALTLWGFVHKLHTILTHRGARDVFFCSREGWFLRKLFDIYQEYEGGRGSLVRSHYLMVSRRSTLLPSLGPLEEEDFPALFPQYHRISLSDFLLSLNFNADEISRLSTSLKVDPDTPLENFPESDVFRRLRRDVSFQAAYEKKRAQQRRNFRLYLDREGIDVANGELHLVDVGWKGTIQDNIFRLVDKGATIRGYYLGLIGMPDSVPNNTKVGVLFSRWPSMSKYYRVFNENRALFEIVLGADHASVDSYEMVRKSAEAVGSQDREDTEWFHQVIEPVQQTIEARFREICEIVSQSHFLPDEFDDLVAKNHARLVFFPTQEEINFFKSLHHKENFGVFGFTQFDEDAEVTFTERIGNLWKLIADPQGALQSAWWKPLALQNMGLGLFARLYGTYRYLQVFTRG